jgi:hypothetical protein
MPWLVVSKIYCQNFQLKSITSSGSRRGGTNTIRVSLVTGWDGIGLWY